MTRQTTPTIRLVALDVDGTLLRPDRTISPRVRHAVRAAVARGVPVVLASARPPRALRAIHEALGLTTPQVNYNGALAWDRVGDRCLSHAPLTPDVTSALIAAARAMLPTCTVSVEHLDRWFTDRVDERFVTETSRLFPPDHVGPLASFSALGATKLMLHAEPAEILPLRAMLEQQFAGRATFVGTDPDLLQITDPDVSKWKTLRGVAATLGVTPAQILAVGDNENDVEMIREAGVGVAMANGTPASLAAADWIAPSNVDDGVAAAIERFIAVPP